MIHLKHLMSQFNHLQTRIPSLAKLAFQEFILSEDMSRSVALSKSVDIPKRFVDTSKTYVDTLALKEISQMTSES